MASESGSVAPIGLDQAAFERHVATASDLCPVSNALRGGVQISVNGELEEP
jgi:organic hydroperoxide reductase OsmC/OhrA